MRVRNEPSVAASGAWHDDLGIAKPAGEAHAWYPGANQTMCGLALSRSRLHRFPHVTWTDVFPESGGAAEEVRLVCPRCLAASGRRLTRNWTRTAPRP